MNLPVIALCDSDSPLQYVDIAIPANNKGKLSIGLMYWMLAREVLRFRGTIPRDSDWTVPVDLFFHRDIEELKKADEQQKLDEADAAAAQATIYDESEAVIETEEAPMEGGVDSYPVAETGFDSTPADAGWDGAEPTGDGGW